MIPINQYRNVVLKCLSKFIIQILNQKSQKEICTNIISGGKMRRWCGIRQISTDSVRSAFHRT